MASNLRILVISILIASLGILSIYSSNYQKETNFWQLQVYWVALGVICFFIMSSFSYRRLLDAVYILYGLVVILLLLVFILGVARLGAQRWLKIYSFNLQPSELAKLVMVIFLAKYFSRKSSDSVLPASSKYGILHGLIIPFIFTAIPMVLIIEQPDLGSALMIFFIFIPMLYLTKVRLKYILVFLLIALAFAPVFWQILRDYQKERLLVFLNPNMDPLGAGYTLIQSKVAIGSGAFFGKGWLLGTQSQLHFLPESHTDFIFATFAEEWGFLGSSVLILLYYFLIREGFSIAQKTSDHFGRFLAFGISLMFSIQIFINLGMTMGLAPVVGLPLPLMSYGGSSTVVTFISLGILASINRRRGVL